MAANRKYTDLTRRAIYELAAKGHGATEITRLLAEGKGGVPAIEIPRRTVAHILALERRKHDGVGEWTIVLEESLGPEEILRRVDAAVEELGTDARFAVRGEDDGELLVLWDKGPDELVTEVTRLQIQLYYAAQEVGSAA